MLSQCINFVIACTHIATRDCIILQVANLMQFLTKTLPISSYSTHMMHLNDIVHTHYFYAYWPDKLIHYRYFSLRCSVAKTTLDLALFRPL